MARLYRRGNVWYCEFQFRGIRTRKALDTDKRFAYQKLLKLLDERDARRFGRPVAQDVQWGEFRQRYLEYSKTSKRETTHKRDKASISAFEKFYKPRYAKEITTTLLEKFRDHRKQAGKGVATINRELNALKAMMRKAAEWSLLHHDAIPHPKGYKDVKGKLLYYTVQELSRLIRGVNGVWKTIALLGARAGLRRSEIYWLSWEDINFEKKLLSVTPKDGWTPKDNEVRHIPMPDNLYSHLKDLQDDSVRSRWVLGDPRPGLGTISTYFRKLSKRLGLKGRIHTLRHTYASHLAQAGVPIYDIGKLLGHSDPTTTQVYAHLSPNTLKKAVDRLPKL